MNIKGILSKLRFFGWKAWKGTLIFPIVSEQHFLNLADKSYSDLNKFEHKTYSQYGEDGIIEEIFSRIGTKDKTFVEIGSGSGLENNTLNLLIQGWKGSWIDARESYLKDYKKYFSSSLKSGDLKTYIGMITSKNVNQILADLQTPAEIDLLSLDIDGNDYYVLKALTQTKPRVLVIEYNAAHSARSNFLQKEDANGFWQGGNFYGASLKTLNALAEQKGYKLVACNLSGNNAFFVRSDLVQDKFMHAGDVEKLYQKPRYYLAFFAGTWPDVGEWVKPDQQ